MRMGWWRGAFRVCACLDSKPVSGFQAPLGKGMQLTGGLAAPEELLNADSGRLERNRRVLLGLVGGDLDGRSVAKGDTYDWSGHEHGASAQDRAI